MKNVIRDLNALVVNEYKGVAVWKDGILVTLPYGVMYKIVFAKHYRRKGSLIFGYNNFTLGVKKGLIEEIQDRSGWDYTQSHGTIWRHKGIMQVTLKIIESNNPLLEKYK